MSSEISSQRKRQSHPELYILLALGVKPDVLIKKGYSKVTVYSYNRKVKDVKEKLNELISDKNYSIE